MSGLPDYKIPATMPPREIAAHTQIDVEPDHEQALEWGDIALTRALEPDNYQADPTLPGEIERNTALRLELSGAPIELVTERMHESFASLEGARTIVPGRAGRELAASHLLYGRILRHQQVSRGAHVSIGQVRTEHTEAGKLLRAQHNPLRTWDRYATMNDRHRATSEAVLENGSTLLGAAIALHGIWRAVRAANEGQPPTEHKGFVAKQVGANILALFAATTRHPLIATLPGVRTQRDRAIQRLVD